MNDRADKAVAEQVVPDTRDLAEARDLAVRIFGAGSTVSVEPKILGGGYRGRVFDGGKRVRILCEGFTSLAAVREVVEVLEASEVTS